MQTEAPVVINRHRKRHGIVNSPGYQLTGGHLRAAATTHVHYQKHTPIRYTIELLPKPGGAAHD